MKSNNRTHDNTKFSTKFSGKYSAIRRSIGHPCHMALLGGALLSLSALNAHGQTVIRRAAYARQTTFANGQTATIYAPYTAYPNYAYPNYTSPNLALTRSLTAANAGLNNRLNSNTANSAVGAPGTLPPGPPQSQTTESLTAQYAGSSQLLVQWAGNPNGVSQVKLGVFDANGNMIASQTLTQMPVAARFPMTADVAYYGAQVQYASGKVTTTYQPLQ